MRWLVVSYFLFSCVPNLDGYEISSTKRDAGVAKDVGIEDAAIQDRHLDVFMDGARDVGFDSGHDGAQDVGTDSAIDGVDSSLVDSGQDANDAASDAGSDACVPHCTVGGSCGAEDGCGGRCLGVCPDPDNEVCYGGFCSEVSWCASSRCDPFSGTGCSTSETCNPTFDDPPNYVETRCIAPGSARQGEACEQVEDCAAGLGCDVGKCRPYCCHAGQLFTSSTEHCRGGFCERFGSRLGYCVEACHGEGPDACAEDQLCIRSSERAGLMYCIESVAPEAQPGDTCEFSNSCAHGQFCHRNICRLRCEPEGIACPSSTSCMMILRTPRISVCLPDA